MSDKVDPVPMSVVRELWRKAMDVNDDEDLSVVQVWALARFAELAAAVVDAAEGIPFPTPELRDNLNALRAEFPA